jgi:hypothetical protein
VIPGGHAGLPTQVGSTGRAVDFGPTNEAQGLGGRGLVRQDCSFGWHWCVVQRCTFLTRDNGVNAGLDQHRSLADENAGVRAVRLLDSRANPASGVPAGQYLGTAVEPLCTNGRAVGLASGLIESGNVRLRSCGGRCPRVATMDSDESAQ